MPMNRSLILIFLKKIKNKKNLLLEGGSIHKILLRRTWSICWNSTWIPKGKQRLTIKKTGSHLNFFTKREINLPISMWVLAKKVSY